MYDILEKIKETLNTVVPYVLVVLAAMDLTHIVQVVDEAWPLVIGGLGVIQAVLHIWCTALRSVRYSRDGYNASAVAPDHTETKTTNG
jgi:hypothetical protein